MKRNSYLEEARVEAKTPRQEKYIQTIKNKKLIVCTGPAGTGKSYVAAGMAAMALKENRIEKLIITRPAVEAGEKLGYLPGDIDEKIAPYLAPFLEILNTFLGVNNVKGMIKSGRIEVQPLAYLRGRTFNNCYVLLDEAQNTTKQQAKLFLTRIGENCKIIMNGDCSQSDIKEESGLHEALRILKDHPEVGQVHFKIDDIVRSGLARFVVEAYEKGA